MAIYWNSFVIENPIILVISTSNLVFAKDMMYASSLLGESTRGTYPSGLSPNLISGTFFSDLETIGVESVGFLVQTFSMNLLGAWITSEFGGSMIILSSSS